MAARRPTVLVSVAPSGLASARALCAAAGVVFVLAACEGDPSTVLQSDLPQVPGMVGRESGGLRQTGDVVESGTFSYKGAIPDLRQRLDETKSRFSSMGWQLRSERVTKATAKMEFTKGNRRATVEIIRNDLSPVMSTAVTTVRTEMDAKPAG